MFIPPPGTGYLPHWYISRRQQEDRAQGYLDSGSPVLLWGSRDQGCTWLSHHIAHTWRDAGADRRFAIVDFRRLGPQSLKSLDRCARGVAAAIEEWMHDGELSRDSDRHPAPASISERWDTLSGDARLRLSDHVKRVLRTIPGQLLIVMDHADLVHTRKYYQEFAALLRSWAEKARFHKVWKKLRLLVSVSVHPARLCTAEYESPFANLSDPIQVRDFDRAQVTALVTRHGMSLIDDDIKRLRCMVGGHPYLSHAVLWDVHCGHYDLRYFERRGPREGGMVADYLQRDRYRIDADPSLGRAFADLVQSPDAEVPPDQLDELIRLGLVKQGPHGTHPISYPIFEHLLERPGSPSSTDRVRLVYCHADAAATSRARLEAHLALLQRDHLIDSYRGHRVGPDDNTASRILGSANIILVLVTSDLMGSGWLKSREAGQIWKRERDGKVLVVPVILRSCDWEHPPLSRLHPVPRNGLPISRWIQEDDAWAEVAQAIRQRLDGRPLVPADMLCKVLFLSANPEPHTPLAADQEYRRIVQRLSGAQYHDRVQLIYWPDTHTVDLPKLLHDHRPDIVHFTGHGAPDGSLLLRNDTGHPHHVAPDAIASYLARHKDSIRLVVLNACYSQELIARLRDDIGCVVGMASEVTDHAAIVFARTFYGALFDNRTFHDAFADSCTAIAAEGHDGSHAPHISAREGVSLERLRLFGA